MSTSYLLFLSLYAKGYDYSVLSDSCRSVISNPESRNFSSLTHQICSHIQSSPEFPWGICLSGPANRNVGPDCDVYYSQGRNLGKVFPQSRDGDQAQSICHTLVYAYCNNICQSSSCAQFDSLFFETIERQGQSSFALPPACQTKMRECQATNHNSSQRGNTSTLFPELEQATAQCEQDAGQISSICTRTPQDMESTLTHLADQTSRMISQGALDACSATARNASAVQAALGTARTQCTASYQQCRDSCQTARDIYRQSESQARSNPTLVAQGADAQLQSYQSRLQQAQSQCQQGEAHLNTINQNLQQVTQAMQRSQECAAQLSASAQVDLPFSECRKNPNQKGCEWFRNIPNPGDCSKPENASSTFCFCQQFPGDSRCSPTAGLGLIPTGRIGMGSDAGGGGPATAGAQNLNLQASSFGGGEDPQFPAANPRPNAEQAAGGGGGWWGGGGGGGGSAQLTLNKPMEKNTPQVTKKTTFSIQNIKGASNTIGQWLNRLMGGGSSSGQSSTPADAKDAQGPGGQAAAQGSVDLRRFLPGSLPQGRSFSSVSGMDGITGPFSDNFKKINARYVSISPSLNPN